MSKKNSYTTASRLDWNEGINLVNRLYRDKEYRWSLFVGCGIFFGLRVSDLRKLTWRMLLASDQFTLNEQKTKKRRTVTINSQFKKHIIDCHKAIGITNDDEFCFLSKKNMVYSNQRINVKLKYFKAKYGIDSAPNFSCHSLRKCFGFKIWSEACKRGDGEKALILLQDLLNHSSSQITKIYLGIRQEELSDAYGLLQF